MEIAPIGVDEIERLEPLWQLVHSQHQAVAPNDGPYVDAETTWRVRREVYRECLSGEGFALIATEGGADVAYALVAITSDQALWADTWIVGARVAELESLAVVPEARGRGIGTLLLDDVDAELTRRGIGDMVIGAVAQNTEAIRLYERRGFRVSWTVLTRFASRSESAAPAPFGSDSERA